MNNGTIPESAVYVLGGIIALIVILGLVLTVIVQVTGLRTKAKIEAQCAIDKAVVEATQETESKIAFKALTKSVDNMNETVSKLSKGVGDKIDGLEKEHLKFVGRLGQIEASARSAHKRMDEHRQVEHSLPIYQNNNHYAEEDEGAGLSQK